MKKWMAILILLPLVLSLSGCSEKEAVSTIGDAAPGNFSVSDIELKISGKTFRPDGDVNELLKMLGEDYEYSEAISCAYDGMDKKYTYENLDITTYPDGEIDRVSEIAVYSGEVETAKGLKIGDPVSRMEELYGTGYEEAGITINYQIPPKMKDAEGAMLYFTVENGVITSIAVTAEILTE